MVSEEKTARVRKTDGETEKTPATGQNSLPEPGSRANLPLMRARAAYDALDRETKDEAAAEYGLIIRAFEP